MAEDAATACRGRSRCCRGRGLRQMDTKKYASGVVIGKFYPPHRGHHFLIDTALAHCDQVYVLVCAKADQDVPGPVRHATLKEAHPAADVRLIDDNLPDDDSAGWAAYTRQVMGFAPTAVFTSENYGDAYAKELGAEHVLVDQARTNVPCS